MSVFYITKTIFKYFQFNFFISISKQIRIFVTEINLKILAKS